MIFNHITLIRAEMSRKSKISVSTRHPDFAVVADANNAVAFIRYLATLLVGSSNEREIALEKDIQFILGAFPMNERLVFNCTYAGYRGSLTFTEDIYDNN